MATALRCWLPALALALAPPAHAVRSAPDFASQFDTVRALLAQPESRMDLAGIKLSIDQMLDPAIDKTAVAKQLDDMAAEIRASFPPGASRLVKFKALRDHLYRPALLSGRQPFVYDLENDRDPRAKLLSVYLATHKGNCVSMPLLFVILGQKLGIPVTIATAPAHLYVKYLADNGRWYGVETTSGGGWADDDWQRQQLPRLTETAIANGTFLRPLTTKETAVIITDALLEHYASLNSVEAEEARIRLALLQLEHDPRNVFAMVNLYLGYRALRQKLFVEKYALPADIPPALRPRFLQIENDSLYWGHKAKALGYVGSTPAMEAAYRERIRRALAEGTPR